MERPLLITASYASAELDALDRFFGLFMGETALTHESGRIAFASGPELIQKLEEIAAGRLRQTVAFVHLPPSHQNPFSVGKFNNLDGLATELVLSFPEVQFVFLGVAPKVVEEHQIVSEFALADRSSLPRRLELLARHSSGWLPIFDPSGLRAHLLSEMNSLDQRLQPALFDPFVQSRRERVAFVADEETSWAFMNGYLAYKAGFRAALLTTRAEFVRHVKPVRRADCGLILADLDLQFPDDTGERLMKKGQHTQELFLLDEIEWETDAHGAPVAVPIYLITGCKDVLTQDLCNHLHLLEDVEDAKIEHCRSKPYPGLFSILTPGGTTAIPVLADNFKMLNGVLAKRQKAPPAKPEEAPGGYRHTAPYRRLRIANRLLRRAAMLGARECKNPQDLVHAALLATEAKEILGGMSRTTYFEAVAMQNEYETQAELAFFGSAANVEARSRLDHMRDELRYAKPHSSGRASTDVDRAIYNCSLQIIGNLRTLYSRAEQVDGSEECLRQVARDEKELGRIEAEAHRSEPRYRRIKAWLRRRGLAYVDAVTDSGTSLTRLAVFNLLYILAFGVFFAGILKIAHIDEDPESKRDNVHPTHLLGRAFSHSFFTFVQVAPGPPRMDALVSEDKLHDKPGWKQACYWTYLSGVFAEMAVAYVHLGLLVAMLYRRLTRHAP